MSFIEAPLGDVQEEKLPTEGMYDLRIRGQEEGKNNAGDRSQVTCFIVIENEEDDYVGIMHWLTFPNRDDWDEDEEKAKGMIRRINRFLDLFGIPVQPNGFDAQELEGATARALVKLETGDDGVERPRIVVPRIKE